MVKAKYTPLSKQLRKNQTPWESKLWRHLRAKNFGGHKFKRQVPIEKYIVDFCCQKKNIIIELDGGGHADYITHGLDELRTKRLSQKGYKILRFWNNEISKNIDGVLETIVKEINSATSPHPSPTPGEGVNME